MDTKMIPRRCKWDNTAEIETINPKFMYMYMYILKFNRPNQVQLCVMISKRVNANACLIALNL